MIEMHLSLLGLKTQVSSEVDGHRNVKCAPPSESHLKLATGPCLDIHVVHPEGRMQAKSHLFNQSIGSDVLVCKLDKHGPLVRVFFKTTCWHYFVTVAENYLQVKEVA